MKNKKVVILVVAIGIVALSYFLIKKKKAQKEADSLFNQSQSPSQPVSNDEFPLKNGSKGDNVKKLQDYLNLNIKPPMAKLKVDGMFGPATEAALSSVTSKKTMTKEDFNNKIYKTT